MLILYVIFPNNIKTLSYTHMSIILYKNKGHSKYSMKLIPYVYLHLFCISRNKNFIPKVVYSILLCQLFVRG